MLMRPRFALGELYATPGVIQALKEAMLSAGIYLGRHLCGDWGDVDREDWDANNQALEEGGRVLSAYTLPHTGATIWIITEHDRSRTTMMLPEEY